MCSRPHARVRTIATSASCRPHGGGASCKSRSRKSSRTFGGPVRGGSVFLTSISSPAGARRLIFIDLNLVSDRRYASKLFEALIPPRVQWYGLATSLLGKDKELLALCARSGCRGLLIGLESISNTGLREVHKSFQDPGEYKELIATFHRHGIAIQGCVVFGFDDDSPEVFRRTAEFVVDAKVDLPR